jgi:hypothetical protein
MFEIQLSAIHFIIMAALGFVAVVVLIAIAGRAARLVTMARWRNRALQNIADAILMATAPQTEKEKRNNDEKEM